MRIEDIFFSKFVSKSMNNMLLSNRPFPVYQKYKTEVILTSLSTNQFSILGWFFKTFLCPSLQKYIHKLILTFRYKAKETFQKKGIKLSPLTHRCRKHSIALRAPITCTKFESAADQTLKLFLYQDSVTAVLTRN